MHDGTARGERISTICLAVLTQYRNVTYKQTDRQIDIYLATTQGAMRGIGRVKTYPQIDWTRGRVIRFKNNLVYTAAINR